MQIADVEEDIEGIVERNEVIDTEIQDMKTDINSISKKILAIKVSLIFPRIEPIVKFSFKENINGTTTFGATCEEYFHLGSRRNGTYSIRPDISSKEIALLSN